MRRSQAQEESVRKAARVSAERRLPRSVGRTPIYVKRAGTHPLDPRHDPEWVEVNENTRRCRVCGESQRLCPDGKWRWITDDEEVTP